MQVELNAAALPVRLVGIHTRLASTEACSRTAMPRITKFLVCNPQTIMLLHANLDTTPILLKRHSVGLGGDHSASACAT